MTIQAIETRYKGYRFRSRLEARWAVFFDTLGIEWEYEPEGFALGQGVYYLPDFRLVSKSGETHFWIEIKAQDPSEIEQMKAEGLALGLGNPSMIVFGIPGSERYMLYAPQEQMWFKDQDIDGYPVWCDYIYCQQYLTELWESYVTLRPETMIGVTTWEDFITKYYTDSVKYFDVNTHRARCERLQCAYSASRSARFEHGETPKVPRGRLKR